MPDDSASYRPWAPQPGPQQHAIEAAPIEELLFGGARGGGKTDFLIGDWMADAPLGPAWRGILFRRSYRELEDYIVPRCLQLIPATFPGATFTKQDLTWTVPSGATLRLRYMERDSDADGYQGQAYPWIGIDEVGTWRSETPYRKLLGLLRSADGVKHMRMRCTANPGGAGHQWVMARFGIDRHPMGYRVMTDPDTGMRRVFIPSKVRDNQILMANDPRYIDRLKGVGSPELVRAWLDGDWTAITGAFFDCWRPDLHIIRPFAIPEHWLRFSSLDWGYARPFSHGWWAVVSEPHQIESGAILPRGAMVRYREWYGASEPNVGLRMNADAVAAGILAREAPGERDLMAYRVADPAIFKTESGPSIGEQLHAAGVSFRRGDNTRAAGWMEMRRRLEGEEGRPMMYTFSTCADFIRTLPALQHDEAKPEDLDSDGEDHACDEARYALMSRPWTRPAPPAEKPVTTLADVRFDDLWPAPATGGLSPRI